MPLGIPDDELPMQQREAEGYQPQPQNQNMSEKEMKESIREWTRKRLAEVKAQVIKKGNRVRFAGSVYEVAEVKKFPHGPMIGIYDEPPSKHVDYLSPGSVTFWGVLDCFMTREQPLNSHQNAMKCKFCENETEPGSTVCEDCCKEAVETTEWIDKRPTMKMKPTPGPVEFAKHRRVVEEIFDPFRTICDLTDSEFPVDAEDRHGEFIADAFNVRHETGLSPRELLEQRDNLLEWLDTLTLVVGLTPIAGNKEALQEAMDGARAAIAATKPAKEKGGELPYLIKPREPLKLYNPKFGDDRKCQCGHSYDRHFDWMEEDSECSCKYCGCYDFKEAGRFTAILPTKNPAQVATGRGL